jgi:hypothetical protein
MSVTTYGPPELRVEWVIDKEPYDPGDVDEADAEAFYAELNRLLELYGVYGCVIETRAPACGCCGAKAWEHAASLWSIVGDADYHLERDLIAEAIS